MTRSRSRKALRVKICVVLNRVVKCLALFYAYRSALDQISYMYGLDLVPYARPELHNAIDSEGI